MTFLLIVLGVWLLAKSSSYLIAIFEKEHIRNDLVARIYDPSTWKSEHLEKKIAEARAAGLAPCGSYFTAPHASVVKGFALFHLTPDRRTLVALISARFFGLPFNKVEARSHFADGTALYTANTAQIPDYTGVIAKDTCFDGTLAEVLALHERRLAETGKPVVPIDPEKAADMMEQAEVRRAEAMIAGGFARWADPAQATLRRTWKGALRSVRENRESNRKVVQRQLAKEKAEKARKASAAARAA